MRTPATLVLALCLAPTASQAAEKTLECYVSSYSGDERLEGFQARFFVDDEDQTFRSEKAVLQAKRFDKDRIEGKLGDADFKYDRYSGVMVSSAGAPKDGWVMFGSCRPQTPKK